MCPDHHNDSRVAMLAGTKISVSLLRVAAQAAAKGQES